MIKKFKKDKESILTISNENGELVAIVRRDPLSKKPVVHMTPVASLDEIIDMIDTETGLTMIDGNTALKV